jgi:hypothetical protein
MTMTIACSRRSAGRDRLFHRRRLARSAIGLALVGTTIFAATVAVAEDGQIGQRRAAERKIFTDKEIVDGFFKVTFGAEFQVAGRTDRIRKFAAPVRIYIDNRAWPDRRSQVTAVIDDIRSRIRNLDMAVTANRSEANVVVSLVRDRDLGRTIRSLYGIERARRIQSSLQPQCLSGFRKDDEYRITYADVIIVADAGDFIFYDCIYEELLQALGPINDDSTLPWSMFNDNVQLGFFDIYDQYILNILYHPRIRPGMSRAEVEAELPAVLPEVRTWVAKVNELPP